MATIVFSSWSREIAAVEEKIRKASEGITWPPLLRIDWEFLPALVLACGRSYNINPSRLMSLAAVFQYIFLASVIHARAGRDAARPTLWGDYLYCRFFELICREKEFRLLRPLGQMICDIHLIFLKDKGESMANVATMYGESLFQVREFISAHAAYLTVRMGGAGREEAMLWYSAGRALGRVWASEAMECKAAFELLKEAEVAIRRLAGKVKKNFLWYILDVLREVTSEDKGCLAEVQA